MKTQTSTARGAGLTALIAAGLTLSACAHAPSTTGVARPAIAVSVAHVQMADIVETFEAGGVIEAQTTATITARILAPVQEVRVRPGDRVRAGQVLILLDGRDLDAHARSASASATAADEGVAAAAADERAADAALTLAQASHARVAALFAKRSATAQELDDSTGALRAAEAHAAAAASRVHAATAGVVSARASSDAAVTTAAFAVITAPFDGVVTEKMVEPGNMAASGTPLLRLEDTRGFRLDVRLDESRIDQVKPGDMVTVALDGDIDGTMTSLRGTVTEVSRAVDADARAFLVKIALPESAHVRSGTFGRVVFSGRTRRALTVPNEALVHRGQLTSAFVVEDGVARVRLINASGTEILAGLAAGDVVVVAAPPELTDGRRVTTGGR